MSDISMQVYQVHPDGSMEVLTENTKLDSQKLFDDFVESMMYYQPPQILGSMHEMEAKYNEDCDGPYSDDCCETDVPDVYVENILLKEKVNDLLESVDIFKNLVDYDDLDVIERAAFDYADLNADFSDEF